VPKNSRYRSRRMTEADMPRVLDIESESFDLPWTRADYAELTSRRNCIQNVVEEDGEVVGLIVYEFMKSRMKVLRIGVHPRNRNKGVGTAMIAGLIKRVSTSDRNRVIAEVRETNMVAQYFFRENGFMASHVIRDYFGDTGEDAYSMQYVARVEPVPESDRKKISKMRS